MLPRPARVHPLRFPLCACFLLTAALPALAQAPADTPAPTPTIRTNVRMVVVDVVVHDRSHQPVRGISASSFTLKEAGTPQQIRSFEEHTPSTPLDAQKPAPLPPGQFTNYTATPASPALNIILLDSLNTQLQDQAMVRDQLRHYLQQSTPGTQVAIFALTTRLLLLQGFTTDPAQLRTAIETKGRPRSGALPLGNGPEPVSISNNADAVEAASTLSTMDANTVEFEAFNRSFQTRSRVLYTLDAFNALGRYLSALPGRKNLIWFSGSFPINILPASDVARNVNAFAGVEDMQDEFRDTVDLLSRARVAVYPVDARGVHLSASSFGASAGDSFGGARQDMGAGASKEADSLGTLNSMAEQTGGQAFYNNNDLARAVREAVDDGSSYYTLAYSPSDHPDDGSYRPIHITVDRPGLTLEYRRGYYTDDARHPRSADLKASSPGEQASLRAAMMHGAPDSTELPLRVAAGPVKVAAHPSAALDNVTTPLLKPPFRTVRVKFLVDARGLGFQRGEDGKFAPSVRFIVLAYNGDGQLVGGVSRLATSTFDAAQVRGMLHNGLQFPLDIDIPARQDVFLRVGAVDRLKQRFGSTEFPVSALRSIPAVDPLPPAQNSDSVPAAAVAPTP